MRREPSKRAVALAGAVRKHPRKSTNITAAHREAFEALISGEHNNFALLSCFLNGKPTAAIVAVNRDGRDYIVSPLFVALTPGLVLTDHDGRPANFTPRKART
jgi:hypothetical protein